MLSELCVRRPVTATMLVMSLVVLGIFSFRELGVDLFPRADPATVSVALTLPGTRPGFAPVTTPRSSPAAVSRARRGGFVEPATSEGAGVGGRVGAAVAVPSGAAAAGTRGADAGSGGEVSGPAINGTATSASRASAAKRRPR